MKRYLSVFAAIVSIFVFGLYLAHAGDKQLTFEWQQDAADLPELDHWELFMTFDDALPFDQWQKQGDVPYTGTPEDWYQAPFTITVPDNAETATWFKMTAVDKDGNSSDPSDFQEGAPTIIDFKAPAAVTDLAATRSGSTITLTWSTDPADTDIAKQEVFTASAAGGPYTTAGEGASPFTYQLQANDPNPIYFVVVLTDDDGNFSGNSNEVSVRTQIGVPFGLKVTVTTQ